MIAEESELSVCPVCQGTPVPLPRAMRTCPHCGRQVPRRRVRWRGEDGLSTAARILIALAVLAGIGNILTVVSMLPWRWSLVLTGTAAALFAYGWLATCLQRGPRG